MNKELIEQISRNFKCPKCSNTGAIVDGFSATGKGLSKMFDIQHKSYTSISCTNCGYTEIYNDKLSGKLNARDWLDIFIGG